MKEHDGPKTLGFLLHTSSDHSMIPDSHLFQERVMFSLEIPLSLSLSMDTRKPLERSWKTSLDQIPVMWLKLARWIQACTTHPRPGRSGELIYWGTQPASGIALEMPHPKYLLLEIQTEKLRASTTMLIMQGSARWFSPAHWEKHTRNVATAGGCCTLKMSQLQTRKNIFISEKYGRKGSSVCVCGESTSKFQSPPSINEFWSKMEGRRWAAGRCPWTSFSAERRPPCFCLID